MPRPTKLIPFILVLLLWGCVCPGRVMACRYNVRDIGFVDLDPEPYRFYSYVRNDTPGNVVSLLTNLAAVVLAESNIHFELIQIEKASQHPALKYLGAKPPELLPAGVLVSPDGQRLPVPLLNPGQPAKQSIQTALQQLVSSPKRAEIAHHVQRAFGVILFLEGPQPAENQRVQRAIASAIEQIGGQMKLMPKLIAQPPVMVVIKAASIAKEQVLLWSLGLETNQVPSPRAAIIYGRARWMGPLMKGDEITERNLTGILSIIGADCECGLDISWTQGTRLPIRWDPQQQSEVTRLLGFDPENPQVKIEVSRILERSSSNPKPAPNFEAKLASVEMPANSRASALPHPTNQAPGRMGAAVDTTPEKRLVSILVGMAMVALVAGLWIVWRTARKHSIG